MKLWRFFWDVGRMGEVDGLFFATEEEVEAAMGQQVYFGEILGKHSEIFGPLEKDDLSILDIDEETVAKLQKAIGGKDTLSGYNPLHFLPEEFYDNDEPDA